VGRELDCDLSGKVVFQALLLVDGSEFSEFALGGVF
jgi:hypothetical protein